MWTILTDHTGFETNAPHDDQDAQPIESMALRIDAARVISFGLDSAQWYSENDLQEEMDLWLGRGSVKFQVGTMLFYPNLAHGLATPVVAEEYDHFTSCKRNNPEADSCHLQRFCGWTMAHLATNAELGKVSPGPGSGVAFSKVEDRIKCRLQYAELPYNSSLLDLCCQELFVTMMMSLVELKAEHLESATFVERGNTLRLEHPVVSEFVDSFVNAGLGTYSDAMLCIVPALRSKMPPLKPDTILPGLIASAQNYRQELQWKRAETLLRFGCERSVKEGVSSYHLPQALGALCELYRWALSMFTEPERTFGTAGIQWISETYSEPCRNDLQAKAILMRYVKIVQRFQSGDADEQRVAHTARMKSPFKKFMASKSDKSIIHLERHQKNLLQAIQKGDRNEALYQLCLITPDCENSSSIPNSALALAARNDWPEFVLVLLELHVSPNDADEKGKRAIYHCAELGHEACARLLLENHASLESIVHGRKRFMTLHAAARNGHIGMVRLLLDNGSVEKDLLDDDGLSPLMTAASHGMAEIVKLFLNTRGVNIEPKDTKWTPLSCASERGHVDVIHILLNTQNLNLERSDRQGRTPFWLAVSGGHEIAAKLLLEKGANIEARDDKGRTPLARAVEIQSVKLVRLLLEKGAKPNTKDKRPATPLMDATSVLRELRHTGKSEDIQDPSEQENRVSMEIVDLLIQHNADTEVKGRRGMTALAQAADSHNTTAARLLLAHGADKESRDSHGMTPLMLAARGSVRNTTVLLLEAGAHIEATDVNGETALFHALNSTEMLELLIDNGANIEAKNNNGETALLKAQYDMRVDAMRLLIAKGANDGIIGADGISVRLWLEMLSEGTLNESG